MLEQWSVVGGQWLVKTEVVWALFSSFRFARLGEGGAVIDPILERTLTIL
jgi:hypothetical protein